MHNDQLCGNIFSETTLREMANAFRKMASDLKPENYPNGVDFKMIISEAYSCDEYANKGSHSYRFADHNLADVADGLLDELLEAYDEQNK